MDHTAVKAVLETPYPSGKHARWWTKVYGTRDERIVYHSGQLSAAADTLFWSPQPEVQARCSSLTRGASGHYTNPFGLFCRTRSSPTANSPLPQNSGKIQSEKRAHWIALQASQFTLEDGVLFYLDPKQEHQKRAVVPSHLRE